MTLKTIICNTTQPFTRAQKCHGIIQSFYGNRQQGTVMLQKTFQNHMDQAGVSVYGNDNTAGGGLQYVIRDRGSYGSGTVDRRDRKLQPAQLGLC